MTFDNRHNCGQYHRTLASTAQPTTRIKVSKGSPIWQPSPERIAASNMTALAAIVGDRYGPVADYSRLHRFSVAEPGNFWGLLWDELGILGENTGPVLVDGDKMPGARFFPRAKLNFAQNLLRKKGGGAALVFRGEDKIRQTLSWDELHAMVSRLQQAMRECGVGKGDRVAAMTANMPAAVASMLAAASLGALWSSCSPDFGVAGVMDRFGQIEPKLFIACDGYWYNGKEIECGEKIAEISARLNVVRTVVVPYLGKAANIAALLDTATTFDDFIAEYDAQAIDFLPVEFSHPLYILFSSGTTGAPKCIVHSQGGALLQHMKEHRYHCDLRDGDRLFYFTTCGWMMWNWLASGLASGCTLMLYDGSPFYPDGNVLFDYAQDEGISFFGTSAKFIDALRNAGLTPANGRNLSRMRTIASTGSPLSPDNFDYVYCSIHSDVHLASMSGGTDIVSCFVLGNPNMPVYRGEIQVSGLGMEVEVWDEAGSLVVGEKGELVCTRPFPSMPVGFWNDPTGEKYHSAYFERFENVWCHGDFAEITANGGMIIHGRSDATLNPGGVRIGTAEIYNQVEQLDAVEEALCIGQEWEGDVRVVLFVRLTEGLVLDDRLTKEIKNKIRTGASPRHVPSVVVQVADIPRTKSGKITELAVREVVHGRPVKNREALANPEALELYRDLPQLARNP
jgi:acetoacetyl-CoA synthetase